MTFRTRSNNLCSVCGSEGKSLHLQVTDTTFNTPGEWNYKKCLNPDCGLLWLSTRPTEKDLVKIYRDYYTHGEVQRVSNQGLRTIHQSVKEGFLATRYGYSLGMPGFFKTLLGLLVYLIPPIRADLEFSVMYLSPCPGGKLLDVGCGNGKIMRDLEDAGWRVEGVDFDPVSVKTATNQGLRVRLGTLEEQNYPADTFDAIIASHFIEHIYHPSAFVSECHRILKPGGSLVIVTPNNESWGHQLFGRNWRGLEPPRHLHVFSLLSLLHLVRHKGLQEIKSWTSIRGASWNFLASRCLKTRGEFDIKKRQPLSLHMWARVMQIIEWGLLKFGPDKGEEIAVVLK